MTWKPTKFLRFIDCSESSTGVAHIKTDDGEGFIKPLGNAEGPHALIKEYLGTSLAKSYGLKTFEFALININKDDEIPLGHNKTASHGPAFITKLMNGANWGGTEDELKRIHDKEDLAKLIVFDTLILNPDRFPPKNIDRKPNYDNVFLALNKESKKKLDIIAMDFTHCLNGIPEITNKINNISFTKSDDIYGFFPEFKPFINKTQLETACQNLSCLNQMVISTTLDKIPREWGFTSTIKKYVNQFLIERISFLCDNFQLFSVYYDMGQTALKL